MLHFLVRQEHKTKKMDDKAQRASKRLADMEIQIQQLHQMMAIMEETIIADSSKLSQFIESHKGTNVVNSMAMSGRDALESSRRGIQAPQLPSFESIVDDRTKLLVANAFGGGGRSSGGRSPGGRSPGANVLEPPRRGLGKHSNSLRQFVLNNVVKKKQEQQESSDLAGSDSMAFPVPHSPVMSFEQKDATEMKKVDGADETPAITVELNSFVPTDPNAEQKDEQAASSEAKSAPNRASMSATGNVFASRLGGLSREIGAAMRGRSFDVDGPLGTALDILFIVTAVFTSIFTISLWNPNSLYDFEESPPMWLILWLAGTYTVGAAWMFLRFFIRCRIGDWEVVDDLPSIRRTYLKGWFIYDIIYSLPIDLVCVGSANTIFYYLMLRHFLRYPRMLSLGKSVNPLLASRMWFGFVSYLGTMVLVAHAVGNVFWRLQIENNESLTYIQSLYWAVASMTSVGYGDFVATSDNGRAFSCFAMFLGICMIATFSAWATAFVLDKDAIVVELENRKAMMHSMLKYYSIPWEMQREVIQVIPAALNKSTESQFRQELDLLPDFMQAKLVPYFNAHQLKQIPLFAEADEAKVLQLSSKMTKVFVPMYDFVYVEGDAATTMLFISHGVVELLAQGPTEPEVVQQLRDGRWFGEEIFKSEDAPTRTTSAQAITNCELIALDKESLSDLIAEDQKIRETILFEYRARKVNLARVQRMIRRRSTRVKLGATEGQEAVDEETEEEEEEAEVRSEEQKAGAGLTL